MPSRRYTKRLRKQVADTLKSLRSRPPSSTETKQTKLADTRQKILGFLREQCENPDEILVVLRTVDECLTNPELRWRVDEVLKVLTTEYGEPAAEGNPTAREPFWVVLQAIEIVEREVAEEEAKADQ